MHELANLVVAARNAAPHSDHLVDPDIGERVKQSLAAEGCENVSNVVDHLLREVSIGTVGLEHGEARLEPLQNLLQDWQYCLCLVGLALRAIDELRNARCRVVEEFHEDLAQLSVCLDDLFLQNTVAASALLSKLELLPAIDCLVWLGHLERVPKVAQDFVVRLQVGCPLRERLLIVEKGLHQPQERILDGLVNLNLLLSLALDYRQNRLVA